MHRLVSLLVFSIYCIYIFYLPGLHLTYRQQLHQKSPTRTQGTSEDLRLLILLSYWPQAELQSCSLDVLLCLICCVCEYLLHSACVLHQYSITMNVFN